MTPDATPKKFFTPAIIGLLVVNIIFLSMIGFGLFVVFKGFHDPLTSWLGRLLGV